MEPDEHDLDRDRCSSRKVEWLASCLRAERELDLERDQRPRLLMVPKKKRAPSRRPLRVHDREVRTLLLLRAAITKKTRRRRRLCDS